MIAQTTESEMGVDRVSRPRRDVEVLAMPDTGLDTTWRIESVCNILLGASVLQLLLPGMAVGVLIDRHCVADRMEVPHWLISATHEVISNDEGVEFWPWIVEAMELPSGE